MGFLAAAVLVLILFLFLIHDFFEISALKYGVLKGMATQSKEVDRELRVLLKAKTDNKILNREFKKLEKIYLARLNVYLMQHNGNGGLTVRRGILEKDDFSI